MKTIAAIAIVASIVISAFSVGTHGASAVKAGNDRLAAQIEQQVQ